MEVRVTVHKCNGDVKLFKEIYEENLASLIVALKNIKGNVNDYLTNLVNEENGLKECITVKSNDLAGGAGEEHEEDDFDIGADFIDSEIKKELERNISSRDNINFNDKRTKTRCKKPKRLCT